MKVCVPPEPHCWNTHTVADPGFPVGGAPTHWGGAPTSDMNTFQRKHVQKRKNWILLGAPPGSANAIFTNVSCKDQIHLRNYTCADHVLIINLIMTVESYQK